MDDKLNQNNATPTPDLAEQARLQRERRRRFIRLGAGSVPVGLTLTSRPVMAWHCYTTSAWGSQRADGVAAGTSVYNRLERNVGTTRINGDECWSITNWVNNTGRGSGWRYATPPWQYVGGNVMKKDGTSTQKAQHAKDNLSVGAVFPGGFIGGGTSTKCWDVIKDGGHNTLAGRILIAGLNRLYAEPSHKNVMNACLNPTSYDPGSDQLALMARLGTAYKPPGRSVAWTEQEIKSYLSASYLAVV